MKNEFQKKIIKYSKLETGLIACILILGRYDIESKHE
jgi:hypothetical protein